MTITLVTSTTAFRTDGNASTANITGVAEGDLIVMFAGHRSSTRTPAPVGTGWSTGLFESQIANASARRAVGFAWKVAPASPGTTVQWAWNAGQAHVVAVFVFRTDTSGGTWQFDGSAGTDNATTVGDSLASGSVTPANDEGVVVASLAMRHGAPVAGDFTVTNSYATWIHNSYGSTGSDLGAGGSYKILSTSSAQTTTIDWSAAADDALATTFSGAWSVDAGGDDVLTGTDVTAGVPTVDAPSLGQTHVLTSSDTVAGAPVLDSPTLGQTHELTATDVTAGAPTVDVPTLGEGHVLTGTDVTAGAPTVDSPTVAQVHVLTGSDITAGAPTVDAPDLGQVHVLTGTDVATGAPTVDAPTLAEGTHTLTGTDVVAGTPAVDAPTVSQVHVLTGTDVVVGTPTVDAPTLAESTDVLTGTDITAGAPTIDSPTLGQVHALTGTDVTTGAPTVDAPTLVEGADSLTGTDVVAGTPTVDAPTLGQIHVLTGTDVVAGTPTVDSPTVGQVHVLVSIDVTSGAPTVDAPSLTSVAGVDNLTGTDVTAGVPTVDSPSLGQVHVLTGVDVTTGVPTVGSPSVDADLIPRRVRRVPVKFRVGPARVDLEVYRTDAWSFRLVLVDPAGSVVDASGWTVEAEIAEMDGTAHASMTVDTTDAAVGIIDLSLTAAQTAALVAEIYRWDLRRGDTGVERTWFSGHIFPEVNAA